MPTQKGGLQPEQENRTKAPRSGIEQVDLFIRSLGGSIRPIRDSYLEEWQLEKVADYALQPGESVLIRLNIPEGMPGGQIYAERGLHSNIHEIVYDGVGGAGFMSFGIPLGAPEGTLPVQAGELGDEMQVYENERYGYRLSLPRGMKMKKNVLADGDGGIFAGGNIEIRVWGENTRQDNLRGNCQAL